MIAKTGQIKHLQKFTDGTNTMLTVKGEQPDYVYLAVQNARCPQAEVYCKEGDHVKIGTVLGLRHGPFFEQPIHSSVSGEVVGTVKKFHRSGKLVDFIQIKNDKKDEFDESIKERTPEEIKALTKDDFVEILKNCALVGLGGSSFPTYIKFQTNDPIDTILINGIECEPYISADQRMMLEHSDMIMEGITYVLHAFGAKKAYVCVKKKYQDLADTLNSELSRFRDYPIEVKRVGNFYPQGWEIALIKSALGIQVPSGVLPSKYGVLVLNVSTVVGLWRAIRWNMPVYERYFTLTGDGINIPTNFRVRVGTSLKELIDQCGGYKGDEDKYLILGGPMMGANLVRDDAVVTKTCTSCIVLNAHNEKEEPCVRCGSCVYSCPAGLQPVQIMQAVKNGDKESLFYKLNIRSCILCGMCSYTCTSKIPLTDYCRKAKTMIGGMKKK